MPHPAPAHKSFADRASLYQEITEHNHCPARTGARALGAAVGRRQRPARPAAQRGHQSRLLRIRPREYVGLRIRKVLETLGR
jgi:hypothetical protein